jgi:hypothetical protein
LAGHIKNNGVSENVTNTIFPFGRFSNTQGKIYQYNATSSPPALNKIGNFDFGTTTKA